ncbi:hypothetical protein KSP40_PGU004559 [Platanthera guangdongensis]|uniref:60S acidic ribosomal protein P1 n=1 Tax=Platanthera guangdongensis TaxID=2320717 RepID=A0ABR2MQ92_9ASPA
MPTMSIGEQACSLAALILYDDGIPIMQAEISTLVKSAKISFESYWGPCSQSFLRRGASMISSSALDPVLFSILFSRLINFVPFHFIEFYPCIVRMVFLGGCGPSVAIAAPSAGGGGSAATEAAPAAEEEAKEESDDDMGFSLFD